jgi:hypothetical protein
MKREKKESLKGIKNVERLTKEVKAVVANPDNYHGKTDDAWTLSEMIADDDNVAGVLLQVVTGSTVDGSQLPHGAQAFKGGVKLKVLSRQACIADKSGTIINSKDKTFAMDPFLTDAPGPDDEPVEGDIVIVKGGLREGFYSKQPLEIVKFERQHEHEPFPWREGKRNYYSEYHVDADGCITVEPIDAISLLSKKGEKLVFPKFAIKNSNYRDKPQRTITNWWFREVPPTYKKEQSANPQKGNK